MLFEGSDAGHGQNSHAVPGKLLGHVPKNRPALLAVLFLSKAAVFLYNVAGYGCLVNERQGVVP